jgi:S-formylglutathione hydrolase FrmB
VARPGGADGDNRPVRRLLATAGLALLVLVLGTAPAAASRLETWTTQSRFVDPSKVQFNGPPPGGPELAPGLRVNVLLPDGFDRNRRYPVLYLLHGHGDRFDFWANPERGDVAEVAKGFTGIIVMPEGARGWYTNWWNDGARGSPAWERYHLDELIPLVQRRLPIRRARRWHAIAGLSMGGEGALFYASQRPGYFGSAASFSGPIAIQRPEWPIGFDTQGESHADVFGDPDAQRFYWSGHNPTALAANLRQTRVFVTVGDGVPDPTVPEEAGNQFGQVAEAELHQHAEDFVATARAAGVDVTYHPRQGIHDWRYWRAHLADAIDWGLFRPVPAAPSLWGYETVAAFGDAWGLRYAFKPAPEGVERFSLDGGRRLRGFGTGQVTIATPSGCRFEIAMEKAWVARLPAGWRHRGRSAQQRRRARSACEAVRFTVAVPD